MKLTNSYADMYALRFSMGYESKEIGTGRSARLWRAAHTEFLPG
jgi:hypothetical protein